MRPEDFSAPFERLVKLDFGSKDLENRYIKASKLCDNVGKHYDFSADDDARLNMTLFAMYEDKNDIHPVNFTAVGSILLEFMMALADHMGWLSMVQVGARKHEVFERKSTTGFSSEHKALIDVWGDLLSFIDRDLDVELIPEFNVDKVSAFTKSFFDSVEEKRYIFFVKDDEEGKEKEEEENNSAANR